MQGHTPTGTPGSILYLNHVAQVGGAEHGLIDIVRTLDRRRFRPIAALPCRGPLADRLAAEDVPVHILPLQRLRRRDGRLRLALSAAGVLPAARRLAGLLRREGVSLLHANSDRAQVHGALAARWAGIPSVWHHRDLVGLGVAGPCLARLSSKIVATSGAVREHLRSFAPRAGNVVTIHNGIDTDRFDPARFAGAAPGGGDRPVQAARQKMVAMVAHMVPWKKHALFLRAAAQVAAAEPGVRFAIAGTDLTGDHAAYVDELQGLSLELGLSGKLTFAGHVADMPALLAGIDVLVHPADREPFGRVVAEAMAMGRPVVAVNAAGPGEIVRHGTDGFLTPPDDAHALAGSVLRIIRNPDLAAAMGAAARDRIRTTFSLSRFARDLAVVYDELIASRPGPA